MVNHKTKWPLHLENWNEIKVALDWWKALKLSKNSKLKKCERVFLPSYYNMVAESDKNKKAKELEKT